MSEQTPEEGTDQQAADDASAVEVPNITDNARSGLDHEPLTAKRTTLVGRGTDAEATDVGEDGDATGDGTGEALPPVEEPADQQDDALAADQADDVDGGTPDGEQASPDSDADGSSEPGDNQPEQ